MLDSFEITRRWPAKDANVIQLYSLPTPNGVKVSAMLEETGLPYEAHLVNIMDGDQFTPEYLSLNPNNKIPAIIDPNGPDLIYKLVGVIGEEPLRQYLALLPGNKLQTISATYDVENDTWVDVFAGEDRLPGEWGHWTGQGMNWNANCAY